MSKISQGEFLLFHHVRRIYRLPDLKLSPKGDLLGRLAKVILERAENFVLYQSILMALWIRPSTNGDQAFLLTTPSTQTFQPTNNTLSPHTFVHELFCLEKTYFEDVSVGEYAVLDDKTAHRFF